ncbi:hypothetical protein Pelo_18070 [Pelomyxa schiedti]|nr:hypothetical protein Pelo_18070 [Pelomyxa schiedti]
MPPCDVRANHAPPQLVAPSQYLLDVSVAPKFSLGLLSCCLAINYITKKEFALVFKTLLCPLSLCHCGVVCFCPGASSFDTVVGAYCHITITKTVECYNPNQPHPFNSHPLCTVIDDKVFVCCMAQPKPTDLFPKRINGKYPLL